MVGVSPFKGRLTTDQVKKFYAEAGNKATPRVALEGENPDAIREGVHVALADCEDIFKAHEVNRRMKDTARTIQPSSSLPVQD